MNLLEAFPEVVSSESNPKSALRAKHRRIGICRLRHSSRAQLRPRHLRLEALLFSALCSGSIPEPRVALFNYLPDRHLRRLHTAVNRLQNRSAWRRSRTVARLFHAGRRSSTASVRSEIDPASGIGNLRSGIGLHLVFLICDGRPPSDRRLANFQL